MIRYLVPCIHKRTTTSVPLRCFSWDGHGTDLLAESLNSGSFIPKIILQGHSTTGFDINKILKKVDPSDKTLDKSMGIVHLNGSILCFPHASFMWNVNTISNLTAESLAAIDLYLPKLEYLLLGSSRTISPSVVKEIRDSLRQTNSELVVEPMDLANAMGTFNILNAEDRRVCAALILHQDDSDESN
ncbi:unnamed protein product [Cylindrotheca closterium]|uniref:NADH dehydrogenase [ubiquinone] 1 alpha subcomplex assembly factor 3 n=1 Tax=Cylindrotheca closterium TaxID=2856 RepID=A0AAD2FN51_9STRA|nr:unnamed protein product [Cylindrotheca closterium]